MPTTIFFQATLSDRQARIVVKADQAAKGFAYIGKIECESITHDAPEPSIHNANLLNGGRATWIKWS